MLFTLPGETVFDPAFGSSSLMKACVETGRNYVGVEKSYECFKVFFFLLVDIGNIIAISHMKREFVGDDTKCCQLVQPTI